MNSPKRRRGRPANTALQQALAERSLMLMFEDELMVIARQRKRLAVGRPWSRTLKDLLVQAAQEVAALDPKRKSMMRGEKVKSYSLRWVESARNKYHEQYRQQILDELRARLDASNAAGPVAAEAAFAANKALRRRLRARWVTYRPVVPKAPR